MGKSVVVTVGDELLAGRTTDTNAAWLSARLREGGFAVVSRETVPDDAEAIAGAIGRSLEQGDVVVVTGGLGPTPDDLTRDGVALALGAKLVRSPEAESQIRHLFERVGRELTAANLVQADAPEGAAVLENSWGTAPGLLVERSGALLFVLPGVPREMRKMTERHLLPRLADHPARSQTPVRRALTLCGLGESEVGARLGDLMARGRNPTLGSYPATASIVIQVEARDGEGGTAEELVQRDLDEIRRRLGPVVVGEGELRLHEVVAARLMELKRTLAVAESLTGGRIADLLVSVPGVSSVFLAGIASYANEAKRDLLGVSASTLASVGAVSEACAREMAEGARRVAHADIGLSTTGIAGPTGGSEGKPIGTVFIGLATKDGTDVQRFQIPGDRPQIRERATTTALNLLRRSLK